MPDTEEHAHSAHLCRTCGSKLERRFDSLKYRRSDSPDNEYPGTLFAAQYFWCSLCDKGYMSSEEIGSDLLREQACEGAYVFVTAPLTSPAKTVRVVNWISNQAHAH